MAARRGGIHLICRTEGYDACVACFARINEALENAGLDDEVEFEYRGASVRWNGSPIVWSEYRLHGSVGTVTIKPAPPMILFIGWLMTILPSRATVTWYDGWPHVHCPPHDDRDDEDDPTPMVPDRLIPA